MGAEPKLAQGLVTFCSLVIFRFGIVVVVVVGVVGVKYLRGKTGNLMRPTGNMSDRNGTPPEFRVF